jgi:hypothetical protein
VRRSASVIELAVFKTGAVFFTDFWQGFRGGNAKNTLRQEKKGKKGRQSYRTILQYP